MSYAIVDTGCLRTASVSCRAPGPAPRAYRSRPAVLLGSLGGTLAAASSATAFQVQGGVDLSGQWSSNWGAVLLQHSQTGVTGTWLQPAGMGACPTTSPGCLGEFTGGAFDVGTGVLTLAYYQSWNNTTGSATFQLSSDGKTLTGTWTQPDASDSCVLQRQ